MGEQVEMDSLCGRAANRRSDGNKTTETKAAVFFFKRAARSSGNN